MTADVQLAPTATSPIPDTMRAAVLFGAGDIRVVDRPVPQPGPHQVLVEVAMCGTCGTDLKIFDGHFPQTPPFGTTRPATNGPVRWRPSAAGWTSSRPVTGCASRRTAAAAVATTA